MLYVKVYWLVFQNVYFFVDSYYNELLPILNDVFRISPFHKKYKPFIYSSIRILFCLFTLNLCAPAQVRTLKDRN